MSARLRRCYCGRPVGALSTCGCCCAEHDDPRPSRKAIPEHLRIDDIQDYLRQKGEL